jgi:large subunit ribosomal protein L5e
MTFVKIQKNNTYYKRFQVKFRRRREGKTDYYQRKRLITQRKNKYNTPKWRFVVRRTNNKIICQVVWSTIVGDKVKTSADSSELKNFGVEAGLTNYAAAYATGLLTARRLLTQLDQENKSRDIQSNLAQKFNLVPEATGEFVNIAELAEKKNVGVRPFTCFLDLGLARATVGNRVFAAMKGAVDGGLNIPHSDKIFPKAKSGDKKDAKAPAKGAAATTNLLRERIFGLHVQTYMDKLRKDNTAYQAQFSQWDKNVKKAGVKTLEELYKKVHAAIRANPLRKSVKKTYTVTHTADPKNPNVMVSNNKRYRRDRRLKNEDRKKRANEKIMKFLQERSKK